MYMVDFSVYCNIACVSEVNEINPMVNSYTHSSVRLFVLVSETFIYHQTCLVSCVETKTYHWFPSHSSFREVSISLIFSVCNNILQAVSK